MKKLSLAVLLSVLCPLMTHAETASPDISGVVNGNSQFAFELYEKLKESRGNLFFSPYSISAALAMTYAGAKGDTEKQMAETLRFSTSKETLHASFSELQRNLNDGGKKGTYELSIANALWRQKGTDFIFDFIDLLKKNYGAGLNDVDFRSATETARQTINQWVENETRDKIKELIKPGVLSGTTRLVLTNAIYFKGIWENQFNEAQTGTAPFKLSNGEQTDVPMMYQKGKFRYAESEVQILELPYKGNDLSMLIILPRRTDSLINLEKSITPETLKEWSQPDNMQKTEVLAWLPKFKLTSEFSLKEVLKSMGMTNIFDKTADFSGMTGKRDIFISEVIHKAFVEVNEEGTEAAGATAVIMERSVSMAPAFRADHPFIFMIRDNASESILFLGRVMNPNE